MRAKHVIIFLSVTTILFAACSENHNNAGGHAKHDSSHAAKQVDEPYKPADQALQDTIIRMDSILFHAYNTCDTATYESLFSEDLEFYHDGGGLETSKAASVASYKKYVCGKVTRELLPGSIEVSPVPRYGAVAIGKHRFHNSQEPNAESDYARFVIVWKREPDAWKITRVISLH